MMNPLVSVIVLGYNHSPFVEEAISSVVQQRYKEIQVIGVDDASTDGCGDIMEALSTKYSFRFIRNGSNQGNCSAFNRAFLHARGKYIIDLSADDLLMPDRISKGVRMLESLPGDYGIHFCDAELIDEKGRFIKTHYRRDEEGRLQEDVPQGYIFKELVERYFICTTSMMIRKSVLQELGGYDENLSYEDFDFWVRSSKKYRYAFSEETLVKKRILKTSHSRHQKRILNRQIRSTAVVCEKAYELCETPEEFDALAKRISYEMKWALATGNFNAAFDLYRLRTKAKKLSK